jgi:hypothetical protein
MLQLLWCWAPTTYLRPAVCNATRALLTTRHLLVAVLAGWVTSHPFSLALDPVSVVILTLSGARSKSKPLCICMLAVYWLTPAHLPTFLQRPLFLLADVLHLTASWLRAAVIHATFVSSDGNSNWLLGVQLVALFTLRTLHKFVSCTACVWCAA